MKKYILGLALLVLLVQTASAQPNTTLSVNPSYSNLNLGDSLNITIDINTTDFVYAFDVSVYYDPAILNATGIIEGNFLKKDGASTFTGTSSINNGIGKVQFAVTRFWTQTGVSGTGTLFTINFKTRGAGTSRIGMDGVQVVDNTTSPVTVGVNNGSAKVNTPPAIQAAVISPGVAYTQDTLDCGFLVIDPDAQDTIRVNVTWLKNGGAWTQDNENGIVITSGVWGNTSAQGDIEPVDTARGNTWVCRVRAYDGLSGVMQDSPAITIQNSLPTQPVVDVTPNTPYTTNNLLCSITTPSQDADGDAITYSYAWYKNGVLQPGLTANTISSSLTAKNQTWRCRVTPNDGTGNGSYGEDQVTILNSKPVASSLVLSPSNPKTTDNLIASYTYSDADGDPESGSEIRWYKNGALQGAYNNQLTIPSSATIRGQQWYFTAKPRDGSEFGDLKASPNVTIQNSPPGLSPIGNKIVLETDALQFTVSATDNDNDTLVYGTNASFGTFNTSTGQFTWATGWYDAGVYNVLFNVTDGSAVVQEAITITVNNSNRIPSIDSYSPLQSLLKTRTERLLTFTHTSSDQDLDDTLAYSWRVNGTQRATSQNWGFSPGLSDCGDRDVRIVVTDSHNEVSHSWIVNVKLSGDVDLDRDVDIFDLAAVGLAYGSKPGNSNWNANADLYPLVTEGSPEGDGVINIFDLATVGLNYGKKC